MAFFDRSDIVLVGRIDFFEAIFGKVFGERFGAFIIRVVLVARHFAALLFLIAQSLLFFCSFGFRSEQGFAVFLGYLVIIGMDFAESQETVTVAAKIYERCLKRRFDPGYFS